MDKSTKWQIAVFLISLQVALFGFFGVGAFAVEAAIVAVAMVVIALGFIAEKAPLVGWLLFMGDTP